MKYETKDSILGIIGIAGFVSLVISAFAAFASIWDGGLSAPFTTWVFLLLACGSALVMHGVARLRVKLWTERIKKL
jgi:predicted phage tail protein